MKITKLSDFNKAVSNSIYTVFLIVTLLTCITFFILYKHSLEKERIAEMAELKAANQLLQSNLSEKLSIIANSNIFLDYLRSGSMSRSALLPDFLSELLPLNNSFIEGMVIYDNKGNQVFEQGGKTKNNIKLSLCYLNNQLNTTYGSCDYSWTLYLKKNEYFQAMSTINNTIKNCAGNNCQIYSPLNNDFFGSFPVLEYTGLNLSLMLGKIDSKAIYLFSFGILIMFLILYSLWVKLKFKKIITKNLIDPIQNIADSLHLASINPYKTQVAELDFLIDKVNLWRDSFNKEKENEQQIKLGKLASQVAHDIRSPVAALNACLKYLPQISDKHRILMQNASDRVNYIANNLLVQYNMHDNKTDYCLIAPLLESIISEKRLQFEESDTKLELIIEPSGLTAFAKFNPDELKRVLSNLINNAYEAFPSERKLLTHGKIIVTLKVDGQKAFLAISDNGCGIPAENLFKVLDAGVSFKKGGSGLGLSHAKKMINSWYGDLSIKSTENYGTEVIINLPQAKTPDWFLYQLTILPAKTIAILEDDQSIHDAWQERITNVLQNIEIKHFKTSTEFIVWYKQQTAKPIVLSDYQLNGETITGLDVIEQLNITDNAVLITSYYQEPVIMQRCQKQRVKLLAKNLLPYLPINIG